jgi:hypothetical protein
VLSWLKNIFMTATMVAVATVVGAMLAACALVAMADWNANPAPAGFAVLGGLVMIALSLVIGVFFCFFTLPLAAVTMPPVLGLTHLLKLPRPLMDILGGGAVGLLCASTAVEMFDHDKLAGMISVAAGNLIVILGMAVGGLVAYIRHATLVRGTAGAARPPADVTADVAQSPLAKAG